VRFTFGAESKVWNTDSLLRRVDDGLLARVRFGGGSVSGESEFKRFRDNIGGILPGAMAIVSWEQCIQSLKVERYNHENGWNHDAVRPAKFRSRGS